MNCFIIYPGNDLHVYCLYHYCHVQRSCNSHCLHWPVVALFHPDLTSVIILCIAIRLLTTSSSCFSNAFLDLYYMIFSSAASKAGLSGGSLCPGYQAPLELCGFAPVLSDSAKDHDCIEGAFHLCQGFEVGCWIELESAWMLEAIVGLGRPWRPWSALPGGWRLGTLPSQPHLLLLEAPQIWFWSLGIWMHILFLFSFQ